MGIIQQPQPVKFFAGITFSPETDVPTVLNALQKILGEIDVQTEKVDFSFTRYYEREMGPGLKKFWVGFAALRDPGDLALIKRKTNAIEADFMENNRRRVNIDPGYIEKAKMILASTKNFSHRIYLGRSIYGDLQYRYRQGTFTFLEWTYPDYQSKTALDFFMTLRKKYVNQLEAERG